MRFTNILGGLSIAIAATGLAPSALAAACDDNFTSTGNFLSGKVYKTFAELPTVTTDSAWQGAYLYTVKDGWKILQSDQGLGIITTTNAQSQKVVPMNIAVEKSGAGSKISMSYTTPMGVTSPDDAVKAHFCKTIAAAGAGTQSAAPAGAAPVQQGSAVSTAPTAPVQRRYPNTAAITPEQLARIGVELPKNATDLRTKTMVDEASATIRDMIERLSCMQNANNAAWMNATMVPGAGMGYYFSAPLPRARYHNQSACMTVTRVQGWSSPALNALSFEVVYVADDSGESSKTRHEMIKQPDGTWLFSYHQ